MSKKKIIIAIAILFLFIRYNSQAVGQTPIPNVESAVVNFADPNVENEVREALKHAHLTDNPLNNPSLINRNLELRFIEQK